MGNESWKVRKKNEKRKKKIMMKINSSKDYLIDLLFAALDHGKDCDCGNTN